MSHTPLFELENLHVSVDGKEVIKGVSLRIFPGEVHALMGRNGSGKTSLSYTIMGHPRYKVTQGSIRLNGTDLLGLSPEERARLRIFLGFQYPVAVPGVSVANFLRASVRAVRGDEIPANQFRKRVKEELAGLGIPESFMTRSLNDGFSGGEKKRLETLQMKLLEPRFSILDETDSGLDIDALRQVAQKIESMRAPDRSIVLITHYQRMLDIIRPDFVHVFMDGQVVRSGDMGLVTLLEEKGYDWALPSRQAN